MIVVESTLADVYILPRWFRFLNYILIFVLLSVYHCHCWQWIKRSRSIVQHLRYLDRLLGLFNLREMKGLCPKTGRLRPYNSGVVRNLACEILEHQILQCAKGKSLQSGRHPQCIENWLISVELVLLCIDDGNPQRGPRPILVQLSSKAAKNLIMENLYKMKSMEAKFRSVIIAHDMTKAEREDCKALVEVARQRTENESGDWIHRVRGPPGHMVIVRMRKV